MKLTEKTKPDPITIEVVRGTLTYACEEMGLSLRNSAYSHNIKERMDHSCALFDADGHLLAQAEHIPVHLGSLPWRMKNALNYLREEKIKLEEGDMFIFNDPYISGTHLNDVTMIKPVFFKGELLAFSANKAHHVDVGGKVPGSISSDAKELFEEGIIMPPVKLMKKGEIVEDVIRLILSNLRTPQIARGDIKAQIAAGNLGEKRMLELCRRHDISILKGAWSSLLSYTEARMRREIERTIADGEYFAEDCLEDTGTSDEAAWIRARVKVKGSAIEVDFTDTNKEVDSPLNAVFGVTLSATYFVMKSVFDPDGPINEGLFRPIGVYAPKGIIINPDKPKAVSGGNVETSQRIADVLLKALSQAIPDRIPAACHGSMNNMMAGGYDPERKRQWVFYETIGGGSGGRHGKDGVDAIQCNMTNTMNTPIEAMEQYYPIMFEKYGIREGSGGRGVWRGGSGIIRAWKLLAPSATVSILCERTKILPWGLQGGQPGSHGEHFIRREGGKLERLRGKTKINMRRGDMIIMMTPGGGGWGE